MIRWQSVLKSWKGAFGLQLAAVSDCLHKNNKTIKNYEIIE